MGTTMTDAPAAPGALALGLCPCLCRTTAANTDAPIAGHTWTDIIALHDPR
jgi:hypothetical protein